MDFNNDKAYVKLFSNSWPDQLTLTPQADTQFLELHKGLNISQH